jgi:hypothetical protein
MNFLCFLRCAYGQIYDVFAVVSKSYSWSSSIKVQNYMHINAGIF